MAEEERKAEQDPGQVRRVKGEQAEQRNLHARVALAPQVHEHERQARAVKHYVRAPGRHGHQRAHAKEQAPQEVGGAVPERTLLQRAAVADAAQTERASNTKRRAGGWQKKYHKKVGHARRAGCKQVARKTAASQESQLRIFEDEFCGSSLAAPRTQSTCGRGNRCQCCQSRKNW